MNIAINVIFAGLIVFVPNNLSHPSWLTAFLIDDPKHVRGLVLYGGVALDTNFSSGVFNCHQIDISSDGSAHRAEIRCDLPKTTEIRIDEAVASAQPFLPLAPHGEKPGSAEESREKEWLLHISNIYPGIGGINVSKVESAAGAKISFPWDDMGSCELDGEEDINDKYKVIGFRKGVNLSSFREALAESLIFKFSVRPGRLRVILSNGKNVQVINVDCFGPNCLAMAIDNSLPKCIERENPGAHFARYYEVVNHQPGTELLPFRRGGEGHCTEKDDDKAVSQSLLGCDLKLLSPGIPRLAGLLSAALKGKKISTIGDLKSVADSFKRSLGKKEIDIFKARLDADAKQVLNRVICPPVVASP